MKLRLLAVGQRMPSWVTEGYQEYARRLPRDCSLELVEVTPGHRSKSTSPARAMEQEADALNRVIRPSDRIVALDVKGKPWSTEQLSGQLGDWRMSGGDVALLIGGPDGISPTLLAKAHQRWSLSPLTLPHPLVRVVVAEQIYRAWTLLQGHPYHK